MNHRRGAAHHIARREDAGHHGHAVLVHLKQTTIIGDQGVGGEDQLVLCLLGGGDHHGIAAYVVELILIANNGVLLIEDGGSEHRAVAVNLLDRLAVNQLRTVQLGELDLIRTGGDVLGARLDGDVTGALAKRGARHVHGNVAGANDRDALPNRHT